MVDIRLLPCPDLPGRRDPFKSHALNLSVLLLRSLGNAINQRQFL